MLVVITMENDTRNAISVTELTTLQQRFVHAYMTGQYTNAKLASLFVVHPNTISNWLRDGNVKCVIADMQKDTHDAVGTQLKALTLKAVNKLNSLIDSPIDGVALQAVKDILDRGGHKPKSEIKVDKTITTYEQKMQQLIGEVLDVEYEDVGNVEHVGNVKGE